MKSRKTFIIILAGVVVVAVAAYYLLFSSKPGAQVTVKVSKGQFPIEVTTTGELVAKHSEKILGPSGLSQLQIYQIKIVDMIPDGTVVDSGQFVATLDPSEISNKIKDEGTNLEKLESQVTTTRIDTSMDLRTARDELVNLKYDMEQRQIELDQSKFEPPATIRQAQIAVEKSQRSYDQAQKSYKLRLTKAQANMQVVLASYNQVKRKVEDLNALMANLTVKAPKAGMVIYRKSWDGSKSGAGSTVYMWDSYTVAELPDLREMISKTYVNEIDISKVKVGQPVKIGIDAFPDKSFTGKVIEVANIGEQLPNSNSKVFEVRVQVNEFDSILRPSMTTKNTIETEVLDNVLYIPMEALFADDSVSYVYRKRGGSVIKQQVVTGLSNDNDIIIRAGISKDDEILLVPPDNADNLKISYIPPDILKKFKAMPQVKPGIRPPPRDTLKSKDTVSEARAQEN